MTATEHRDSLSGTSLLIHNLWPASAHFLCSHPSKPEMDQCAYEQLGRKCQDKSCPKPVECPSWHSCRLLESGLLHACSFKACYQQKLCLFTLTQNIANSALCRPLSNAKGSHQLPQPHLARLELRHLGVSRQPLRSSIRFVPLDRKDRIRSPRSHFRKELPLSFKCPYRKMTN